MRKPRTKACEQCRLAKTRCSLSTPCMRCGRRGLDCRYDIPWDEYARQERPRTLKPLVPADATQDVGKGPNGIPPTSDITAGSSKPTGCSGNGTQKTTSDGPPSFGRAIETIPDVLYSPDISTDLFDLLDSFEISAFDFDFDISFPASEAMFKPPEAQLEQRTRSFHQGALTAKMMFGKLASYSRIMADAKCLPPFIYPPCWSSQSSRCATEFPHRCLPETLAVCSNLIQMYSLRRDGSEGFVWQQICAHLKQLRDKVICPPNSSWRSFELTLGQSNDSSDEEAMHAIQAALLYGILCSTCAGSVSRSDADWVVASIEILGRKAYKWALQSSHICSSRQEWVLMESLRRLGCTLYLFDLLLQSTARTPSKGNCDTFWFMPLPCGKSLWEPMSDGKWNDLYQQDPDARKAKGWQGLTLRHLLLFRQAKATGESVTFADELADWCENADDFSTLLWLALTVEGDGQSVMAT